jgi:23S rRNA (uracil1939-C5)-methyltransferase
VRFGSVNAAGDAVARVNGATVMVPFAIPGESAVVEVTKAGRKAEGRLVQLLRKSPAAAAAICPHFGRCGGCQWQHIEVLHQRRLKSALARDVLEARTGLKRNLVADAVGGEAWGYRGTVRATLAMRGDGLIAGFHARGATSVINVARCPVQHPANEAMFAAVRDAVARLQLPVFDPATGRGLVRGFAGTASFATGEALLTLSLTGPPPDPAGIVHALIDRVPGLVGIFTTQQAAPHGPLMGGRVRLLWGRAAIEEVIAGIRLPIRPPGDPPANPEAMGLLCDAVVRATAMGPGTQAWDLTARTPVFALAMAAHAEHVIGVVPRRADVRPFGEVAARNGVANVSFTTRASLRGDNTTRGVDAHPDGDLAGSARRPDVVVVSSVGTGLDGAAVTAVAAAAVPRVVSIARTLGACVHDVLRWQRAGYRAIHVQPIDMLPHTSHLHLVVTLAEASG